MASQRYQTLPSGQKMPAPGLGTFYADEDVEQAVNMALEIGYRHIDTAYVYETEKGVGRAVNKWISSGKLKREDLFITTKLPMFGIHPDRVEMFMKKSLENLQLDYVDLYLIHFPVGCKYKEGIFFPYNDEKGNVVTEPKTDHLAIWRKMEEQVDAGRAKNIGLSNFSISQITTILKSARIKPANLQVELHVFFEQRELIDFCHKNGITVTAYCPLANPSYNSFLKDIGKEPLKLPNVLGDATVAKIAQKHSKTSAQVALKFILQVGAVPIPKSVIRKELEENFNLFDFTLDEQDMKTLRGLDMGEAGRICDFKLFGGIEKHPDYPFPKNH